MRLIIEICGATGVIYGIRLVQVLSETPDLETHVVMSEAAKLVLEDESN
jgi:4-hydroxy-3-polyprenylbenzoate decarboxylase